MALYEWVEANADYKMTIISRPEGKKGWVKLPIRSRGGADVCVVGPVPPAEQGPGKERGVIGGDGEVGDDPVDAQSAGAESRRPRVLLPKNCMTYLTGQPLTESRVAKETYFTGGAGFWRVG